MTREEIQKMFVDAVANINKTERLIVFRAKQETTEAWFCGFYAPMYFENTHTIKPAIISLNSESLNFHPVIPETVGQYTGLTDYNGKRIFEGDIVKIHIGNIIKYGAVFYGERAARIGIRDNTGEANFSYMQQPLIQEDRIVVIGNIYDTPELLKGSETR